MFTVNEDIILALKALWQVSIVPNIMFLFSSKNCGFPILFHDRSKTSSGTINA